MSFSVNQIAKNAISQIPLRYRDFDQLSVYETTYSIAYRKLDHGLDSDSLRLAKNSTPELISPEPSAPYRSTGPLDKRSVDEIKDSIKKRLAKDSKLDSKYGFVSQQSSNRLQKLPYWKRDCFHTNSEINIGYLASYDGNFIPYIGEFPSRRRNFLEPIKKRTNSQPFQGKTEYEECYHVKRPMRRLASLNLKNK
jgi:hypothetical protein